MKYEDYKKDWDLFYDERMRLAFGSASIDLSRLSCLPADDLANDLAKKTVEKFVYELSHGRYYKYFVVSEWANLFVRNDLFKKSKELIEMTRKDDSEP